MRRKDYFFSYQKIVACKNNDKIDANPCLYFLLSIEFCNFAKNGIVTKNITKYLSLVKFSHTVFALPFALIGFFVAITENPQTFNWVLLVLVILCMVFARNAAMAFNRYTDRIIDKKNPRTANREIPARKISATNAMIFTIVNSMLFMWATFFINKTAFQLSPIALIVVLGYSYTKRFTFISHIILGLGLSIAPAGAYIAVCESLNPAIIVLSSCVLLWTAGFDILYSLQDEEFDKENGLFSIPAKYGRIKSLIISAILHIICGGLLIFFNILLNANIIMWIGTTIFLALLMYQHIIVKKDDISKINLAFGTMNGIASVLFALFTIVSLFYTA
jgi:4-hydroxybenzoate polyprenyltransferase